jgi:hypothetical protein
VTRREQWISFYTAALAGNCADSTLSCAQAAKAAEETADAAMAIADARDFPEPKVEALLSAARNVWGRARSDGGLMATLGEALKAFDEGDS